MKNEWDMIATNFKGYTNDDFYDEKDLTKNINQELNGKIDSLKVELYKVQLKIDHYTLFKECVAKYTKFEIVSARDLLTELYRCKSDIEFGEGHLRGESKGTHGRDCSIKLDELNKNLNKLNGLWDNIPDDIKKLILFEREQ
jgi:hypothetical protein